MLCAEENKSSLVFRGVSWPCGRPGCGRAQLHAHAGNWVGPGGSSVHCEVSSAEPRVTTGAHVLFPPPPRRLAGAHAAPGGFRPPGRGKQSSSCVVTSGDTHQRVRGFQGHEGV